MSCCVLQKDDTGSRGIEPLVRSPAGVNSLELKHGVGGVAHPKQSHRVATYGDHGDFKSPTVAVSRSVVAAQSPSCGHTGT